jgi:hypothetical protein
LPSRRAHILGLIQLFKAAHRGRIPARFKCRDPKRREGLAR